MSNFVTYPINRLYQRRRRVQGGKVTHLLGLEDVPDEQLADAVQFSGVILTRRSDEGWSIRIPWQSVLDIVLKERAAWRKQQAR